MLPPPTLSFLSTIMSLCLRSRHTCRTGLTISSSWWSPLVGLGLTCSQSFSIVLSGPFQPGSPVELQRLKISVVSCVWISEGSEAPLFELTHSFP